MTDQHDIKLQRNNDNRNDTDIEWVREFYNFLQGKSPDGISIGKGHKPAMTDKKAYSIIWYLQEHFPVFPDNIERCSICSELYDTDCEGLYWETKGKHYCGNCSYQVPQNYDRGKN